MAIVWFQRLRNEKFAVRDQLNLRGIHQSWLVYAREFDGIMPTPGLVDRLPFNGVEEPGRGEEDVTQNTTANLHAMCIMQNYYSPQIVVSPLERNPIVRVMSEDEYNYTRYNAPPNVDQYWDPLFKADLVRGSNVSYANLVLFGCRKERHWLESLDPTFAFLGNRGPKDGVGDPKSYTCDARGAWAGFITLADNSIERFQDTKSPFPFKDAAGISKPDNIFGYDDGEAGCDVILSFTQSMTRDGPVVQHD